MRRRNKELDALGAKVAVVTFEDDFFARAYAADTKLDWPILLDTDRDLYQSYGIGRGGLRTIYSVPTLVAYLKLMARGRKRNTATSDVYQLGGDVVIDPKGKIRMLHLSEDPADRPKVSEILRTLRR